MSIFYKAHCNVAISKLTNVIRFLFLASCVRLIVTKSTEKQKLNILYDKKFWLVIFLFSYFLSIFIPEDISSWAKALANSERHQIHQSIPRVLSEQSAKIRSNKKEQFSIEWRKTNTRVITVANHKRRKAIHCPIKTRSDYTERGKTCTSKSRLVLVLRLIRWESGASCLSQSLSVGSNAKPK